MDKRLIGVCAKCEEIDRVIAHYRDLKARVTDEQTLDGIARLIEQLEADKMKLHPETDGNGE
jgi:hypothetical protein